MGAARASKFGPEGPLTGASHEKPPHSITLADDESRSSRDRASRIDGKDALWSPPNAGLSIVIEGKQRTGDAAVEEKVGLSKNAAGRRMPQRLNKNAETGVRRLHPVTRGLI